MRRPNSGPSCLNVVAAFIFVATACSAWGQATQEVEPVYDKPTFTTETKEGTLYVSVLDKDGKMGTDVPQSAFGVTENNGEQPIKLFKREDVPVSMCILIDSSGSMREKHASVV